MENKLTSEQAEAIERALASGQKMEAIKIHREATGQGLKESKEVVDKLARKLIEQDPEKYSSLTSSKGSGCASVVVAVLCFGALTNLLLKTIS